MAKTILYDGLNLSLKAGTGIATYTRALLDTAKHLGFDTGIVYNMQSKLPRDPIMREIALFDDGLKPFSKVKRFRRWIRLNAGAPFGVTPSHVPLSGTVVLKSVSHQVSADDAIFAATDLFSTARHHFRAYGRPLPLSFAEPPALLHCTSPLPLRARHAANICTIHDLVPLRLPNLSDDNKRYFYRLLRDIVRRSDHIVTVSEASKRDIVNVLGADERRITNTYQAVDVPLVLRNKPIDVAADEVAGIFNVDWKKYFLFFGALEPKKNVMRLVESYLAARTDLPLVIVGAPGWKSKGEQEFVDDRRFGYYTQVQDRIMYRRQIRRFDFISYPLLVSLIRGARGVLFPSLYEGFGLPVLEAMQLGTPVISSTEGSIPEVAAEAALLVDPYDIDAIRQAVVALASDNDLCAQLSNAGQIQAAKFSVERYRDTVASLYESLL